LRVFVNNGGGRHWLKVAFKDEVNSIGARLTLTLTDGTVYKNQFYTSEGLGSDQTSNVFFGLGDQTQIRSLDVVFQNGKTVSIESPKSDTVIDIASYQ
jgi:hypothetical protein